MPEARKDRKYLSFSAENTITANRFVTFGTADDECNATTTDADQDIIGVARYAASTGENAEIVYEGITDLEVLGNSVNISRGDFIKCGDTAGRGKKTANAGETFHAVALESATADNVVISVLLERGQVHA